MSQERKRRRRGPYKLYEYRDTDNPVIPKSTYYESLKPRPHKRKREKEPANSDLRRELGTTTTSTQPPAPSAPPPPPPPPLPPSEIVRPMCSEPAPDECIDIIEPSLTFDNQSDEWEDILEENDQHYSDSDLDASEEDLLLSNETENDDDEADNAEVEGTGSTVNSNVPDDSEDDFEEEVCKGFNINIGIENKIKMFLLLSTKLKYNLPYTAAESIMELAGVLSKEDYFFQPSKHLMKSAIDSYSCLLSVHHLCSNCGFYIGIMNENEKNCGKCLKKNNQEENLKNGNTFLYMSVRDQMKTLLESGSAVHLIDCANRVKITKGAFEDIFDGKVYKKNVEVGCLSFNFFIDGLQVATTSKNSALPILLTINELPLNLRRSNVLMASVWLGKKKPIMNEYLKPFVKECCEMSVSGITFKCSGIPKTMPVKALMGISDSVARPLLRNSTQFNGRHGCGLCYHPGIKMRHQRGKTRSYSICQREYALRTHEETLDLARIASATGERQRGIRGFAILSEIPGFDIIDCLDLDLFHALVNAAKRFANLWFHSKYSGKPFSVRARFGDVDKRLLGITPTSNVSRAPRSLSERSDFRGHEWFYWVVFYSLPVLKGILPNKYLNHWGLLVSAIVMLMQNCVSKSEVVYSGRYLKKFNLEIDDLYGKAHVTFSIHLLTHLERSVQNFAQPFTHSAFLYESFNGEIKNTVKSSNGIPQQIFKLIQLKLALRAMKEDVWFAMSEREQQYIEKMTHSKKLAPPHLSIGLVDFLGMPKMKLLSMEEAQALVRFGLKIKNDKEYAFYDRCIVSQELYHACSYTRVSKQENSIALLEDENVFQIHNIVVIDNEGFALGHFLMEKQRFKLCEGIHLPHYRIFKSDYESTLRCIPLLDLKTKLLSFGIKFENEIIIFACVNVLSSEMLS